MPQAAPNFPLADADKCVKCALCLPHCPTYLTTLDEGESPRGRIALMQGLATGALDDGPHLIAHLDHCLACRACEAVCPAEVPYGKLIDAARAELTYRGHREPLRALIFAHAMRDRTHRRFMRAVLRLSQLVGLTGLMQRSGPAALRRLAKLLPSIPKRREWKATYSPRAGSGASVSLFLGCVADITQPQVSAAAIAMLNALGVEVHVPASQGCCGALDQHTGRSAQAKALAEQNLLAFGGAIPVLGTASGCLATLKDYALIAGEPAKGFVPRVQDVSSYIAAHERLPKVQFKPWKARALVQSPCTQRNVMKSDRSVPEMLKHIPGLEVDVLPASLGCCGAAGSYMLTQPEQADAFAAKFAEAIAAKRPDVLVTSNVGCSMHLAAALKRRGLDIPVMHPVEVLAQQLPEALYHPV
jgi:glycolate oxidase iron-sulfur subunit